MRTLIVLVYVGLVMVVVAVHVLREIVTSPGRAGRVVRGRRRAPGHTGPYRGPPR